MDIGCFRNPKHLQYPSQIEAINSSMLLSQELSIVVPRLYVDGRRSGASALSAAMNLGSVLCFSSPNRCCYYAATQHAQPVLHCTLANTVVCFSSSIIIRCSYNHASPLYFVPSCSSCICGARSCISAKSIYQPTRERKEHSA